MDDEVRYSPDFKARLAIEAIRGQTPVAEIARLHGVPADLIDGWARTIERTAARVFDDPETDHQMLRAFQESEARMNAIIESSPVGILFKDRERRVVLVNKAFCGFLGLSKEVILGQRSESYRPAAIASDILKTDEDVLVNGNLRTEEWTVAQQDGRTNVYSTTKFPVRDHSGNILGLCAVAVDITDVKRTEAILRESEERYRSLVADSLQGVIIHRDHKPLFVNATWAAQLGFSVEDVMAMDSIVPLMAPPDRQSALGYASERMQGRPAPYRYTLRWMKKDGSWIWTENYVNVVSWEGSPAIQSTVIDVDERVRNEETLRHQRLFIDTVLDTIADGVVACDANGKMTLFNRATRELHGLARDILPDGRTPIDDDLPLLRALRGEKVQNQEMIIAVPNRTPRTVLVNAEALHDKEKGRIGAVAIMQDITERDRVERALKQSEERLAAVINHAPASISLKDIEGHYLLVNEEVAKRFRKTTADFPGRTIFDFADPETAAAIAARDQEVIESRKVTQHEVTARDIDGVCRYLIVTRFPIFGDDGAITAIGGISIDISAQKRTEAELRIAKETAEIASRAKTEFLANMSHELRTPLNSIIGFSHIISEEMFGAVGNQKYREYAGDILSSGRNLLELINDILDVSRIEIGSMPLDEKWLEVGPLLSGATRLMSGRARDGDLRLKIEAPADLPAFKADERRIRQILINLLSNAIKFTPAGGRVALRAYVDDVGRLVFAVSDTGIGIPEDKIGTVLSMFGQVQESMTRSHDGVGLGLPLCKNLTELHGGVLEIESVLGKGTTVRAVFPAERTQASPPHHDPAR